MAREKRERKPVDWDALELQAFNLKFEQISAPDRLKQAQKLATTFREHNEPLPDSLEHLLRLQTENLGPARRSKRPANQRQAR